MNLHEDKKIFEKYIIEIREKYNFSHQVIEKDYYVTMLLEALARNLPELIFKGGTSLSKCYHVVNRFSEDIDITVIHDEKLTRGKCKAIKRAVINSVEEIKLQIINLDEIISTLDLNKYKIDYPSIFISRENFSDDEESSSKLKQYVLLETAISIRSYPFEMRTVKSIIQEYLEEQGLQTIAEQYCLREFPIRTQKLDRTLIDKLFALGDYYISGKIKGRSRHLYDIHKILPAITINDDFKELFKQVRNTRKDNRICLSAQDNVDIQALLNDIISKEIYKKDYEEARTLLIYDDVQYNDIIKSLQKIIKMDIFPR
jgi:hypothetical protein